MSLPTCRVRLRVLVCLSPAHAHPPFAPLPCAGDHCLGRGQAGQSSPLFSTLERVLGFKDMRFPPPQKNSVFWGGDLDCSAAARRPVFLSGDAVKASRGEGIAR